MKFNCEVDDIHIDIEAKNLGPSPKNPKKLSLIDIHIKATRNDFCLSFVSSDHHLTNKEKKLEKVLPKLVEDEELIEHALHHMELTEDENGPEWKK